jgi:hypothetical protein
MVANISTIAGSPNTLANPAIANMSARKTWSAHNAMFTARLLPVAGRAGVPLVIPVSLITSSSNLASHPTPSPPSLLRSLVVVVRCLDAYSAQRDRDLLQ